MLTHAILTDSARLCAARVEFAFRTVRRPAQPNLRRAQETQQPTTKSDAHKARKVGVLNQVGRKRGPRKEVGFPVAGPLGGASTPVRRNGTGPSGGKARGGYTSPIPAEIAWMRWVYLVRGPLVAPIEEKVSCAVLFRKVRVSGGWLRQAREDPTFEPVCLPQMVLDPIDAEADDFDEGSESDWHQAHKALNADSTRAFEPQSMRYCPPRPRRCHRVGAAAGPLLRVGH